MNEVKARYSKNKKKLASLKRKIDLLENIKRELEKEIKKDYEENLPKEGIFDVAPCTELDSKWETHTIITIEEFLNHDFYTDEGDYEAYFSDGKIYCKNINLRFMNANAINKKREIVGTAFPVICLIDHPENK